MYRRLGTLAAASWYFAGCPACPALGSKNCCGTFFFQTWRRLSIYAAFLSFYCPDGVSAVYCKALEARIACPESYHPRPFSPLFYYTKTAAAEPRPLAVDLSIPVLMVAGTCDGLLELCLIAGA